MPKLKNQFPKMYRDRNQAISKYKGKRIYHGIWGSSEAEKSYRRFLAAIIENPNLPFKTGGGGGVFVSELADAFLERIEAEARLGKDAIIMFRQSIGYLVDVYGELAVDEFSPKKLKVCRDQMVKAGTLCRNQQHPSRTRKMPDFQENLA